MLDAWVRPPVERETKERMQVGIKRALEAPLCSWGNGLSSSRRLHICVHSMPPHQTAYSTPACPPEYTLHKRKVYWKKVSQRTIATINRLRCKVANLWSSCNRETRLNNRWCLSVRQFLCEVFLTSYSQSLRELFSPLTKRDSREWAWLSEDVGETRANMETLVNE